MTRRKYYKLLFPGFPATFSLVAPNARSAKKNLLAAFVDDGRGISRYNYDIESIDIADTALLNDSGLQSAERKLL